MIDRHVETSRSARVWLILAGAAILLYIVWSLGSSIASGSVHGAILLGATFVAFYVAGKIADDWRNGISYFFVWLIFEDLVRKYMGNNMYVYFAKDLLVGVTYMYFLAAGSRNVLIGAFRPPFRYALGTFFLLGCVQFFNPLSPSIFYGILGMKLYFYYVPLMFVGYAMLRERSDLRRFLVLTMVVAGVVALIGIFQTVLGLDFLNPRSGADIDELGHLVRYTSQGIAVTRPPAVFVSDGRFAAYLIVVFILGLGTAGFLLLNRHRSRALVFPALGVVGLAASLSGSRSAFLYIVASAIILPIGMIWGAPPHIGAGYQLVRAIRRSFVFVALAVGLMVILFPDVIGAHWSFYRETLTPDSEYFEAGARTWNYPLEQLQNSFTDPDWVTGHGIGTGSLGTQYVARILEVPPGISMGENGYGDLILELGILGPILWLIWTISLFASACRVVLKVRGTWAFPVALSITWFSFLLMFCMTWTGIVQYQNFITNAYFWLMVGILFRLPSLVEEETAQVEVTSARAA